MGDGVHTQINKLIQNPPDGIELDEKPIPHLESAIDLLKDGHGDLVAVSGQWWYQNRDNTLSGNLVLPRREPTRVLVGEDKPEYIPKDGIIIVDCEIVKRQFRRLRDDLNLMLPDEFGDAPIDSFERIEWLEMLRENGEINGYTTTRSLHSYLANKPRRHTLGLQRDNEQRFRFIPVPLEGYTVLVSRKDFPLAKFSTTYDAGASTCLRLEMTILDNLDHKFHNKIGLFMEQRKISTVYKEAEKIGDEFALKGIGVQNPRKKEGKNRIELLLELVSKNGNVTAGVDRLFDPSESHSALVTALNDWSQMIEILKETPTEEKRGRMREIMNEYIEQMIENNRIGEDEIYKPMLHDYDLF